MVLNFGVTEYSSNQVIPVSHTDHKVFVMPELYGISIIVPLLPGEIYVDASIRGWWIRNKANEIIKRLSTFDDNTPKIDIVCDALQQAMRLSFFWMANKKYGSKYCETIMNQIK